MKPVFKTFLAVLLLAGSSQVFAKPYSPKYEDSLMKVEHKLPAFSEIKIGGPFEVHITQCDDQSIKFEAPKEFADRMITEVEGSTLKIRNKHDNWGWGYNSWYSDKSIWRHAHKIVVYLTAKNVNSVVVSGSGNAIFENGVSARSLKLRTSGSGNIAGKIDVKKLESHISGSGEIKLSGNAETSYVRIAGSGKFASKELTTAKSAALVSGSGWVEVNASDKVDATVHGSGGVNYTGGAKEINASTSGSGRVSKF